MQITQTLCQASLQQNAHTGMGGSAGAIVGASVPMATAVAAVGTGLRSANFPFCWSTVDPMSCDCTSVKFAGTSVLSNACCNCSWNEALSSCSK